MEKLLYSLFVYLMYNINDLACLHFVGTTATYTVLKVPFKYHIPLIIILLFLFVGLFILLKDKD